VELYSQLQLDADGKDEAGKALKRKVGAGVEKPARRRSR